MVARWTAALAAMVLLWLLQGCAATGPKGSEIGAALANVPAGVGRIVFFRSSSMMGAALQPDIRLDGQVVGQSKPGGFFYVDAAPGRHLATAATEATSSLELNVVAGQTQYVRSAIGFGLMVGRVTLTTEGQLVAQGELPGLSYTGSVPVRVGAAVAGPVGPAAPKTTVASVTVVPLRQGDQVVYRVTDLLTNIAREAVYTVDRVDAQQISFNQGGRIEGTDGSIVSITSPIGGEMDRCVPPGGWARPDLTLGMRWSIEATRPISRSCAGTMSLQATVVSDEVVATALGEQPAIRIDYEGTLASMARTVVTHLRIKIRAWYASALGRLVRFEYESTSTTSGVPPYRERSELTEIRRN